MNAPQASGSNIGDEKAYLVYDGQCPFCSRYVDLVRFREAVGEVTLVDARQGGAIVEEIQAKGYNLDEGMVLKFCGEFYFGSQCVHRIALMTTPSGLFNRLNGAIFKSPTASKTLYPILKFCRNLTLRLMMRDKINSSNNSITAERRDQS